MATIKSLQFLALTIVAVCVSVGLAAGAVLKSDEPPATESAAMKSATGADHPEKPATTSLENSAPSVPRRPGVILSCSVVKWNPARQKPVLALACPASEGAASVRVNIKLSWMEPADRPDDYQSIFAPPSSPATFRSNDEGAFVWLTVRPGGKEKPRTAWISFNELVSLELLGED